MPEHARHPCSLVGKAIKRQVSQLRFLVRQNPSCGDRSVNNKCHQCRWPSWRQDKISDVVTAFCLLRSLRRVAHKDACSTSSDIRVTRATGVEPRKIIRSSPFSTFASNAERCVLASPILTRIVMLHFPNRSVFKPEFRLPSGPSRQDSLGNGLVKCLV